MIGILVQARMSSSRFPGKVLHPICGKPLLQYLLESLGRCNSIKTLAVATSVEESDDAIADYCAANNVPCFRGPLDDVVARFLGAAEDQQLEAFVRICGDSPLLDYRLVDLAVRLFEKSDADLVTNVLVRSFPKGQSVEVVRRAALKRAHADVMTAEQKEHVTKVFYDDPAAYTIQSFESGEEWGELQLSVDTVEEMGRFDNVVSRMTRPHWEYTWSELVELLGEGV
ncbi:MAG: NTP transferase domain-containing protein [Pseudodesulfovibrio sp.]